MRRESDRNKRHSKHERVEIHSGPLCLESKDTESWNVEKKEREIQTLDLREVGQ